MECKEILKTERKKRNLTQQQVADHLHIARASYTRYETGEIKPTTDSIILLSKLYNLSTDYLLGLKPTENISAKELAKRSFDIGMKAGYKATDKVIALTKQYQKSRKSKEIEETKSKR